MKKYRCKICGYMIEKDKLEDDFKCPLCGVEKNHFEEISDDSLAVLEMIRLAKPEQKKKKYRCRVCGYIVETDELKDDYKCPLCGVGREHFEEISEEEEMIEEELKVEEVDKRVPIDQDNPGIARILEKCINCGRCKTVCEEIVGIKYDYQKTKCAVCIHCGQCVLNCPVGALVPKYQYHALEKEIENKDKIVVALTSPAVRVALGEEFGMESGSFVEGKMVASLRKIGVDYVFDTTFGADLTVMEEASELVKRIEHKKDLPQFSSCCPSWVKFLEIYYPELRKHLSSTKSPISMQTTLIKTYFAKVKGLDPKRLVVVALTPCTAKKFEISREEFRDSGLYWNKEIRDTDYVLTTSEFALMLTEHHIDFNSLEDSKYDSLFDRGSGGGVIFGASGGVTESTVRTAYYLLTGTTPKDDFLKFNEVRGLTGIKEATVEINGVTLRLAVVHSLPNVVPLLEQLKNGKTLDYDFIEVMNCRGGCIGGGGQPLTGINSLDEVRTKRISGLYQADEKSKVRSAHENPDIIQVYQDFLGTPLSPLAEKLLHTSYIDRSKLLKGESSFDIIENEKTKKEGEKLWN